MVKTIENGFIKLHRKMVNWEWYYDNNTFLVFVRLLFMANWKDGRFMGHSVPRGSLVTSLAHLAKKCNLSVQNTRTALNHLVSTGEITIKSTNKFTLLTVTNYGLYQDDPRETNKQLTNNQQAEIEKNDKTNKKSTSKLTSKLTNKTTSETPIDSGLPRDGTSETNKQLTRQLTNNQQTTNKQLTTIEEYKEYKNIRNNNIPPLSPQGETAGKNNIIIPENLTLLPIRPPESLNTPEFIEAWKEWETYRKQKRQKLTPMTIKKQYSFLAEHDVGTAIEIINQSITNGWTGLFELKKQNRNGKGYDPLDDLDLESNPFEVSK